MIICQFAWLLKSLYYIRQTKGMLKGATKEEIPANLLSKDKKVNDTLFKQHYRKEAAQNRNKLDLLLHNFNPGFL